MIYTISGMADTRSIRRLHDNLNLLLVEHDRTFHYVAKKAGLGGSAHDALKEMKSIGLDRLDRIAAVFGLEGWMLLVPKLDPKDLPVDFITASKQKRHEQIERAGKILAEQEQ